MHVKSIQGRTELVSWLDSEYEHIENTDLFTNLIYQARGKNKLNKWYVSEYFVQIYTYTFIVARGAKLPRNTSEYFTYKKLEKEVTIQCIEKNALYNSISNHSPHFHFCKYLNLKNSCIFVITLIVKMFQLILLWWFISFER